MALAKDDENPDSLQTLLEWVEISLEWVSKPPKAFKRGSPEPCLDLGMFVERALTSMKILLSSIPAQSPDDIETMLNWFFLAKEPIKSKRRTLAEDLADTEDDESGTDSFFGRRTSMCLQFYRVISGSTHWSALRQACVETKGVEPGWASKLLSAEETLKEVGEKEGFDSEAGQA